MLVSKELEQKVSLLRNHNLIYINQLIGVDISFILHQEKNQIKKSFSY